MKRLFGVRMLMLLAAVCLTACGDPSVKKQKLLESGNKYVAEGKYPHAIIEYRNAIDIDPKFGEARKKLAAAYAHTGDGQHALEEYVRAADLLPNDVEVQLAAGSYLLAARKPEDAVAKADAALKADPKNIQAHLMRGNALAGLSSFDEALNSIEEAIRLDPNRGLTFTHLGLVEQARGRRAEAEAAFKKAVELAPKTVETYLALGNFYWSAGKAPETEAAFKGALSVDANNAPANRAMAVFAIATGKYRDAEPYLSRIAESGDPSAVFALTDYYLASGRAKDAIVRLEAMGQKQKNVPGLGQRLARAYAASGDTSRAKTLVEQVIVGNPAAVDAQLLKGQLLLNEGKKDDAFATVRATATANPSSAEAQYALGRMYASRGDRTAAEAAYREVLRINPRAASAQLEIARLQLAAGQASDSLRSAEEASKSEPRNAAARLVIVRSAMATKDYARADKELDSLQHDYPNVATIQTQRGLLALLKNDIPAARAALDRAQQLDERSSELLAAQIAFDFKTNNPASAKARIEQRLKDDSSFGTAVLAARTYAMARDFAAAERMLRKAIEVDATQLEPYEMLGQLYVSQKRLDEARTEFEAAAARQAKPVAALTMTGIILQAQGKNAEAQKVFEHVLALDSRAVIAANNLAWMHAESGQNLDTALQLAQTATAARPDEPELMDTLGWVYYKKNLPELAAPLFGRCIEKAPTHGACHYHLGLTYLKTGESARARAALQQALKAGVDAATAADARRALASLQ